MKLTDSRLCASDITLGYDGRVVSQNLSIDIPARELTVIVGPNACGKSTLLRALSRLHPPAQGSIVLDGEDIFSLPTKKVAQKVGLLPQSAVAPEKMLVRDLVARGRSPYQSLLRQWSQTDHDAVTEAMKLTRVTELAHRRVDELSGGQRQRVWLALVLAQETETILLDEPTTFLDLANQIEILELCWRFNSEQSRTVVAVLHDLNQAARYATHLIAMRDGRVIAQGTPRDVVTVERVREVFGVDAIVIDDPVTGTPMVVPNRKTTHHLPIDHD